MKINLKKLFVTAVIGAGLFVSQPAYSALTIEFGYRGGIICSTACTGILL